MRDTFIATLVERASDDDRVMLITGDLGFGVLDDYEKMFPNQYVNAGVAEQSMAMLATGCALSGYTVFTYSIANFPTLRCLEMLRNDVAYHDAPVITVAVGGGYSYGALGMSHHATEDLAILRAIPGMTVVAPADLYEVREATTQLIEAGAPAYLRLDKSWAPPSAEANAPFKIGKARLLRDGDDLTVVATGGVVGEVLAAGELLAGRGISIRVLSMHTLKPFDQSAVLDAARTTGGIVTVEEHVAVGGLGSAVLEALADEQAWPRRFRRLALAPDTWAGVGSQSHLRELAGLDASSIAAALINTLESATVGVDRSAVS